MLDAVNRLLSPSKRSDVPPFIVMDVMAAVGALEAKGHHIVHMEVGQPDRSAPAPALAAARAALGQRIGYTEALGVPSLRARIARHYRDSYGYDLDPARVVVTTGSSGGFILAFLSLFEPGDRVALANPGYPPYRHILTALGCEPVLIETSAATRWALSPEALIAAHSKTPLAGLLVASPAQRVQLQSFCLPRTPKKQRRFCLNSLALLASTSKTKDSWVAHCNLCTVHLRSPAERPRSSATKSASASWDFPVTR